MIDVYFDDLTKEIIAKANVSNLEKAYLKLAGEGA